MILNIITPCIRPKNLSLIFDSIKTANISKKFNIVWYIIFDASSLPENESSSLLDPNIEIKVFFHKDQGISGNGQRNFALNLIENGHIYFLDDDNLLHPEFINTLSNCISEYGEIIGLIGNQILNATQSHRSQKHLIAPDSIDTAQFCSHRSLIGKISWKLTLYNADGHFISQVYEANPKKFILVDKIIAYYNKLGRAWGQTR